MITKLNQILFLTTSDPSTIKAEWPYYQNWTLPARMTELGAEVELLCWRDGSTTVERLASFDKICFLWCNNYHEHGVEFERFLIDKVKRAQLVSPRLEVLNSADFVLWNMNKAIYLPELARSGFSVPRTAHIDTSQLLSNDDFEQEILKAGKIVGDKIVLKPAISGSSRLTHLIQDVNRLSVLDRIYLSLVLQNPLEGTLIAQAFEPAIADGEFSLVFIAGKHTHTMLKTPAQGEFKCQAEFGGGIVELSVEQTPQQAVKVATEVIEWLRARFQTETIPYCRVDGVIATDGFMLMEVEAIEPHLWLETCLDQTAAEGLYKILLN